MADRRLLAHYDPASNAWQVEKGSVRIKAAPDAGDPGLHKNVRLKAQALRP